MQQQETTTSTEVKHWACYGLDDTVMTHKMDINDQRESNGQVFIDMGPIDGDIDKIMSVATEINTHPNGIDQVPCAHVNLPGPNGQLAFSVFLHGDKLLLRMERGVSMRKTEIEDTLELQDDIHVI